MASRTRRRAGAGFLTPDDRNAVMRVMIPDWRHDRIRRAATVDDAIAIAVDRGLGSYGYSEPTNGGGESLSCDRLPGRQGFVVKVRDCTPGHDDVDDEGHVRWPIVREGIVTWRQAVLQIRGGEQLELAL